MGTVEIAIDDISPNPYQPRREFDPQELTELADSIVQQGILQPLVVVRPSSPEAPTPFVLVAGERRLRAAKLAQLNKVPCVIRQASPQQMLEWALVENIQRSNLNPIDRAGAYRQYIDRLSLSQSQAAERLGQPRATVANYLRLLELCEDIQSMLCTGQLSFGHAKVLAGLAGQPARQLELARQVLRANLSVRQLEQLVEAGPAASRQTQATAERRPKPAYLRDLEERLTAAVGTRVLVQPGRAKHAGRIVVDFYSLDDFDRIAGRLGLAADGVASPG
ncbi:MAG: ParB/RepB/Spo0J family partition protein [Gemmatimonadales bacterium]|nr:MAG: ParB/RepB/Spo0J family partition protein [Gemmatimonadales bacterium]